MEFKTFYLRSHRTKYIMFFKKFPATDLSL